MIICVCVHMLYETLFAYMVSSIVTFLSLLSKPPGPQMIVNVWRRSDPAEGTHTDLSHPLPLSLSILYIYILLYLLTMI